MALMSFFRSIHHWLRSWRKPEGPWVQIYDPTFNVLKYGGFCKENEHALKAQDALYQGRIGYYAGVVIHTEDDE